MAAEPIWQTVRLETAPAEPDPVACRDAQGGDTPAPAIGSTPPVVRRPLFRS